MIGRRRSEQPDEEDPQPGGIIHHNTPLPLGGDLSFMLIIPPLPAVDESRLRVARNFGFPPYPHVPLLPTAAEHLLVPGLAEDFGLEEGAEADLLEALEPVPPSMLAQMGGVAARTLRGDVPELETLPPLEGLRFDPLFAMLLFLALALGTLYLDIESRYAVLWAALTLAGAALALVEREPEPMLLIDLGWGLAIGLVFSLPLLILTGEALADTARILFPFGSPVALFLGLVFAAPLGESLFLRGMLQRDRGLGAAVLAAGASGLLLYWPAAISHPVYLAVAVIFSTVLAAIYGFAALRNGVWAALACQVTVNLVLLFLPTLFFGA